MKLTQLLVALPLPLIVLWSGTANAGQTINDVGALACVNANGTRNTKALVAAAHTP